MPLRALKANGQKMSARICLRSARSWKDPVQNYATKRHIPEKNDDLHGCLEAYMNCLQLTVMVTFKREGEENEAKASEYDLPRRGASLWHRRTSAQPRRSEDYPAGRKTLAVMAATHSGFIRLHPLHGSGRAIRPAPASRGLAPALRSWDGVDARTRSLSRYLYGSGGA